MEEITITPLYLDWSFWAVVVATIAVVLSQIPPIHLLLKKAKIDFELHSKINITHKVGNPNLQLHLLIFNIGGRKIRIKEINVSIERDGKNLTTLPAQNYLQSSNDNNTVLFTSFSLNTGEDWGHIINLLNFFDREDEKNYRQIEAKMLDDFRDQNEKEEDRKELIELKPEYVQPIHNFFNRHYIWLPGEYKLIVNILTDKVSADISKSFRFTIFESHSDQLKEITKKFKYGGGIWWDPENIQTGVVLEIKEA
jgi:hypothetical protein